MLKPFKSVSFDLKLLEPWIAGCFVATLVLVQVHAAEKPGAMGQASPQVETTPAAAEKISKSAKDRVPQQSDEAEQAAKLARMRATKGGMPQESEAEKQAKLDRMRATKGGVPQESEAEKQAKLDRMRATKGGVPQQSEAATDKMKMQSKMGGVATNSGALTGQSGKPPPSQAQQVQQVQQQLQMKQSQMQRMMQPTAMPGSMQSQMGKSK